MSALGALFENRSRVLAHEAEQKLVEAKLQLVEAKNKSERLKAVVEALNLVLPMAKGYASEHRVGSNAEYVLAAEEALAAWREP